MYEQEKIIAGNKLITEFMEWNEGQIYISEMKYHSSWEWLMPVFEKINTIPRIQFSILNKQAYIQTTRRDGFTLPGASHFRYNIGPSAPSTIEAVWLGCVEFITWYNQQKQSKEKECEHKYKCFKDKEVCEKCGYTIYGDTGER